jgi:WD40 repeat protein/tRNA A-37 threonylcarbamoyl transferase component Bud32
MAISSRSRVTRNRVVPTTGTPAPSLIACEVAAIAAPEHHRNTGHRSDDPLEAPPHAQILDGTHRNSGTAIAVLRRASMRGNDKACQPGAALRSRMVAPGMSGGVGDASTETRTSDPETQDVVAGPATAPTVQGHPGPMADGPVRDATPLQVRAAARYDLVDEHGRGGLGRVMRARDRELGRTVAIKELLRRGRVAELRFLREALITARLEHPAIVPVHEAGRWPDGTPFYSMKLVAGRPLRDLIDDARTTDDRLAARLALVPHVVAVADAIAYAHAQRIVHRDLKPSNVIVGDYGETVVIDWGLAKDLSIGEREDVADPYRAPAWPEVTEAGAVMGTPAFMAPEQARGEPGDERADVYALGAMLYAVLAGQSPYQGTRSTDIVRAVVDGPPTPLAELAPGAPADLVAVAAAAMERDAGRRLGSARAFADELRRYLRGQQVLSHRYSVAEKILRWTRRHRELSAAVAVGLVVLAAVGAAAVSRIVHERDSADHERRRAESALADARDQREALVLGHARVQAERDPTAALAWLAAYAGADVTKAQELAAMAVGRAAATFSRNRGGVRVGEAAVLSFDPPHVVTIGPDRIVRGWRAGVTAPTVIDTHVGGVGSIALAPSVHGEAAYARDGRVHVIGADGTRRATIALPDVQSMAFSVDGQRLVAAGRGGEVVTLDHDRETRVRLPDVAGRLHRAIASDDGTAVAACDEHGHLWYARAGQPWLDLGPCSLRLGSNLAFSRRGTQLASTRDDGVDIHDLDPQRRRHVAVATAAIPVFLADGHLVVGGDDGSVHLVDLATTPPRVRALAGAGSAVAAVAEAPDGRLALGYEDGTVRVYDRVTGHLAHLSGFRSPITTLQWSADGGALFAADHSEVRISPLPRPQQWSVPTASYRAVYDPGGRWLAVDSQGGDLAVVDRTAHGPARRLTGHRATAFGLFFHEAGLVSAGIDGTVRVWNLTTGAARVLSGHAGAVQAIAGAARGDVYTADDDGRVRATDLATGGLRVLPLDHRTHRLALAPDGARLVVLGDQGHVDVVDTASGRVTTVAVHDPIVNAVAYSPRGSFFAMASRGGRLEVRAPDGERLHLGQYGARCAVVTVSATDEIGAACGPLLIRLVRDGAGWRATWRELESNIYALAFSPDGSRLAAATLTGMVYVVDLATGGLAGRQVTSAIVTSVAFSPDGRELAASTGLPELHVLAVADLAFVPPSASGLAAWLAARRDDDLRPVPAPTSAL